MAMNRRSMLAAMLGGLVAAAVAPRRALALGIDPPRSDLARTLVATLRRPDSAAAVGRAYLARYPTEAAPARLVAGIIDGWERDGFDAARAGRRALRRRLGEQVRRDFARGRVVSVDGWVLSASEARLFALAAVL
jgi:hypothetical protein